MATAGLTFTGSAATMAKITQALDTKRRQAAAALYQVGEEMMTESKKRVPVDTGTLKGSGYVTNPSGGGTVGRFTGRDVVVTLGFGGAAESYAIPVHEDLHVHHRTGQALYLWSVLAETQQTLLYRIAERIQL